MRAVDGSKEEFTVKALGPKSHLQLFLKVRMRTNTFLAPKTF